MGVIFYLIPFLLLNPVNWLQFKKEKALGNIIFEIFAFIIGVIYTFIACYAALADKNISAFIIWFIPIFIIVRILDMVLLRKVYPVVILSVFIFVIVWLYLQCLYPLTISKKLSKIPDVKVESSKIEDTDINHISIIPLSAAKFKGDKVLGQIDNASLYEIGEYHKQKIGDEMYYVAPVEYNGYFSYMKAKHIDYYIKVSAEKDEPAELVKADIKYTPSAWFGGNLQRRVREKYPDIIILNASLEPDDNGKPYYAVSYGHYEYFRSGIKVDGVILFDPSNGDMKKYAINNVPSFVDQVIPEDVAWDYNNWFGKYANGIFNYWFSPAGVHVPTEWGSDNEVAGVFMDDVYYYSTDHTNVDSKSTTMVGYSMMNSRTGKMVYYSSVKGINGQGAISVVSKTFQKEQWKGEEPVLYSIYGTNTWLVPVVDGNGLLREIAAVNAEDTNKVVYADTKEQLFDKYRVALASAGLGNTSPTKDSQLKTIQGKVLRVVNISTTDGTTQKLLLDTSNKIFVIDTDVTPYSVFTKEGDTVEIKYVDTNDTNAYVKEFKNSNINK